MFSRELMVKGFISQRRREVNGLDGSLEGKGKIELQQQRQNPIY